MVKVGFIVMKRDTDSTHYLLLTAVVSCKLFGGGSARGRLGIDISNYRLFFTSRVVF